MMCGLAVDEYYPQQSEWLIEAVAYTYDRAGNRTSFTRANGTASLVPQAIPSATYDAANKQISFAGATLTYDQNGNLTNDGMNTYSWDARNRLAGISGVQPPAFRMTHWAGGSAKRSGARRHSSPMTGMTLLLKSRAGRLGRHIFGASTSMKCSDSYDRTGPTSPSTMD